MWLKCNCCGNVYASGYTEDGELRQAGSPCTPLYGKHRLFMAGQACDGTLEENHSPAVRGLKVHCQSCRNIYPATMSRCPRCFYFNQGL